MEKITRPTVIGEHHTDYKSFFDHVWANRIDRLTKGTRLYEPVFDLCASWKSSAGAFMLPWLVAETLSAQQKGFTGANPPQARTIDGLKVFVGKRLMGRMPLEQIADVQEVIGSAGNMLRDYGRRMQFPAMPAEETWRELHPHTEFRMALFGVQSVVFPAIYYAYEDFLLRVFRVMVPSRGQYRIRNEDEFGKLLEKHLGETVAKDCWMHRDVQIARLVRHAIVHSGCRVTSDLTTRFPDHGLDVRGGFIQLPPPYIRGLFDFLKVRAYRLSEISLKRMTTRNGRPDRAEEK